MAVAAARPAARTVSYHPLDVAAPLFHTAASARSSPHRACLRAVCPQSRSPAFHARSLGPLAARSCGPVPRHAWSRRLRFLPHALPRQHLLRVPPPRRPGREASRSPACGSASRGAPAHLVLSRAKRLRRLHGRRPPRPCIPVPGPPPTNCPAATSLQTDPLFPLPVRAARPKGQGFATACEGGTLQPSAAFATSELGQPSVEVVLSPALHVVSEEDAER